MAWFDIFKSKRLPTTPQLTVNKEEIKKNAILSDLNENWLWYTGNARKLVDYYKTMLSVDGKKDYFYARSALEANKKTHSGIPKAIIDTLCNTTGIPSIEVNIKDKTLSETDLGTLKKRMTDIIDFNDFKNIIKQESRPKTLVIGAGVFIVSNLTELNERLTKPVIEFIDERFVDFEMVGNIFISATIKTNYTKGLDKFRLEEKRSYNKIEYKLFNDKGNEVGLDTLPQTSHLKPVVNLNINMIPAIPCRYKNGIVNYGLSIFEGKIDLFDDLDQTYSQVSELVRKSTITTYIPGEFIEEDSKGNPIKPDEFNRNIIVLKTNKEQTGERKIASEQPNIAFEQLLNVGVQQLIQILTGVLSPSSLGIEVQRNNNAEAMREKEKVTLVTRDDIIDNESLVIKQVINLALKIEDTMKSQIIQDYDVKVDYPDFSSPAFDQVVATLLPLWSANAISPEKFVSMLYEDTLTEDAKLKEIEYLNENKMNADLGLFEQMSSIQQQTIPSEEQNVQQ